MRGATFYGLPPYAAFGYSNPRAPCGARRLRLRTPTMILYFNPRAPCGARLLWIAMTVLKSKFQSTRPMRGATIIVSSQTMDFDKFQSTRPMRGATFRGLANNLLCIVISIHAPHAGRDSPRVCKTTLMLSFQSTRPMRGATTKIIKLLIGHINFNPRAPCGARPYVNDNAGLSSSISIHAPHAGRDCFCPFCQKYVQHFNPRAPCGARPALRLSAASSSYFNPRAPCGARPDLRCTEAEPDSQFQSTRPMRGATTPALSPSTSPTHFNPRAPCGARPPARRQSMRNRKFQSTRPMRGATALERTSALRPRISIHAPHAGRDRKKPLKSKYLP